VYRGTGTGIAGTSTGTGKTRSVFQCTCAAPPRTGQAPIPEAPSPSVVGGSVPHVL